MAKESKADADYGPGHLDADHCAICAHFEPPHACAIVRGEIGPMMWCRHFKRKGRAARRYGKPKSG